MEIVILFEATEELSYTPSISGVDYQIGEIALDLFGVLRELFGNTVACRGSYKSKK